MESLAQDEESDSGSVLESVGPIRSEVGKGKQLEVSKKSNTGRERRSSSRKPRKPKEPKLVLEKVKHLVIKLARLFKLCGAAAAISFQQTFSRIERSKIKKMKRHLHLCQIFFFHD